ncbi:MAG: FAD-dependent oxidoreductase, partial [Candidatus Heimdallarchaeota archaeon]|nr:FAD-dependent oxidoreductase [Candidatus Heimdallarchaeota archaeon]
MESIQVIIIGAGPGGTSAAIRLAQNGFKVALIDRAMPVGSKNLSGGVLWGNDLAEILPEWQEEAPIERHIINKKVGFLSNDDSTVLDFNFNEWNSKPYNGVSILRAKFDDWLASKASEAGVAVLSGITIDSLIIENDQIKGVRQGNEELRADIVILAEGANPRLMLKHGLSFKGQKQFKRKDMMLGIKEVLTIDQKLLEERFLLEKDQGIAGEFVLGNIPGGIKAGGFFYTNKSTISLGVVIHLDSFPEDKASSAQHRTYKVQEYFKNHPYISRLIKDSTSIEYGAKLIPEMPIDRFPNFYGNGYLIVGDAAGFVFSNGIVIQGMNYAIKSGILAADTIIEANGNYSATKLAMYQKKLSNSYILKDFKKFKNVKKMTKNSKLFEIYPKAINTGFKEVF